MTSAKQGLHGAIYHLVELEPENECCQFTILGNAIVCVLTLSSNKGFGWTDSPWVFSPYVSIQRAI
jgi:hypothetical protein